MLGVAVQLCTLMWLGFVPDEVATAPDAVVGRLSQRLGIAMGELFDQTISGRGAAAKQKVAEALAERAKGGRTGRRCWTRS